MIKRELANYRSKLQSGLTNRDVTSLKSVLQNVIIQSTRGVDMSPLFADVILACQTDDIELKKMTYMYLCTYAEKNPDLSILCINTFHKDSIRCMSNFKVENVRDHLYDEAEHLLKDRNTYVRRCALMAVGKIFSDKITISKPKVDFIPTIVEMTLDDDPSIALNALIILKEINDGKLTMTRNNIQHLVKLLHRLQPIEVAEAAMLLRQCTTMEYDDVESIMNAFDDYICCLDPAAVIEVGELFIYISEHFIKELLNDVLERVAEGYIGLYQYYSSSNAQIVCVILNGILNICKRYDHFLSKEDFILPSFNEPEEVIRIKMQIIECIIPHLQVESLLQSFHIHILDIGNQSIVLSALVSLSYVSRDIAGQIIKLFVDVLNKDVRRTTEIKVLSSLIQVLEQYNDITSEEVQYLSYLLDDSESILKCDKEDIPHIIYLCGEYEECFHQDLIVNVLEQWEELSTEIKLVTLTATVKSFLRNQQQCSALLKEIANKCEKDQEMDVRERVKFYLNLIDTNMNKAKEIICMHHY
ncbi:AP-2 complex protein [Entamoeba marina]